MTIKETLKHLATLTDEQKSALGELVQVALWTTDPAKAGLNILLTPLGIELKAGCTDLVEYKLPEIDWDNDTKEFDNNE